MSSVLLIHQVFVQIHQAVAEAIGRAGTAAHETLDKREKELIRQLEALEGKEEQKP